MNFHLNRGNYVDSKRQVCALAIASTFVEKKQKGTTPHGPFPFQHYVREKN